MEPLTFIFLAAKICISAKSAKLSPNYFWEMHQNQKKATTKRTTMAIPAMPYMNERFDLRISLLI